MKANTNSSKALRDLIAIFAVSTVALVVAPYLEIFERFEEWSRRHEAWQVDEFIVVPVVFGLAFSVYFWRRHTELKHQAAERERAEEELRRLNENLEELVREHTRQLKASEAELRALFAAMTDVILVLDLEGRYLKIAPTNPSLLYKPSEDLVGKTLHEVLPREQADAFLKQVQSTLKTWQTLQIEYSLLIDGEEIWFDATISPMLENSVICVARDITERKRSEKSLSAYVSALRQNNRELQDFVRIASHDLQEPLRKVRVFGDRLKTNYADALDERGLDYLGRMEGASARMQDLIDDLLSLSRITTQARPFQPVNLTEVTKEAISDLAARVEETGGRVEVGEMPTIEADRAQMRQLMQNLIGNALKFHKEGEAPLVSVRGSVLKDREKVLDEDSTEKVCQVAVKDNGIGFEEKYLEHIFAPFQRLHGSDAYEGTGMGLAICRRVAERHGGKITAQSTPGQGTTFIVSLPVSLPENAT